MIKDALKTLLFFAAIPAIALAVSLGGVAKMDADLRSALLKNVPDADPALVARITMKAYLAKVDDPGLDALRRDLALLEAMKVASIAVLGFSAAFFAAMKAFGAISARSRKALLRLFRPTYFSAAATLPLLTLANAALLIGAIYFGESLLIERVHVKLIFLIGAGALLGCGAVVKSVFEAFKKEAMELEGSIAAEGSPLQEFVRSLSEEIGAERIDNVVVGDAMTFFATESAVKIGGTVLKGKTVYLSRPIAEHLSLAELKSIVAHELGHFKGFDTAYSVKFYPIYRGLGLSLARLAKASSGAMALALIPTRVMYGNLYQSFALSEKKHSRERELAADAEAVRTSDGLAFSTALLKTSALLDVWGKAVEKARGAAPEEGDEDALALKFFGEADKRISEDDCERMLEAEVFHPFDSHPRVKERILATGIEPADAFRALDFQPKDKASALF